MLRLTAAALLAASAGGLLSGCAPVIYGAPATSYSYGSDATCGIDGTCYAPRPIRITPADEHGG